MFQNACNSFCHSVLRLGVRLHNWLWTQGSMEIFLETERLRLRSWQPEDAAPFSGMNADPEVMEFFPALLTPVESQQAIDRYQIEIDTKGFGPWVAELRATQVFTGFIGLHEATFESAFTPCIEIGWRLDKPFWGFGLATEGARASLDYGFRKLGLAEIFSFTSVLNTRSENVMKKIGMKKIDEFNHPKVMPGSPLQRHCLYRIDNSGFI